jgi:hypothetical protein
MMIMYLLIDDAKNYYADIIARTDKAGMAVLKRLSGQITCLGIDFDLGRESKTNGCDVLKWALAHKCLPKKVQVVSLNPPGREAIVNFLLDNGYQSKDNTNFVKE